LRDSGPPLHLADEALLEVVHGVATPEEREAGLQHIKACADCEKRFLEAWRDRETGRLGPPPRAGGRRLTRVVVPLTAVAAALLAFAVLIPHSTAPLLTPDWLPPNTTESLARGEGTCADAVPVAEVMAAYRSHDAVRVVELLDGRDLPASCDPLRLVLASALLHADHPADTLRVLDALQVESLPQPARDRGRWMRALALDRVGRRRETIAILEKLAQGPGEFAGKASAALARLR